MRCGGPPAGARGNQPRAIHNRLNHLQGCSTLFPVPRVRPQTPMAAARMVASSSRVCGSLRTWLIHAAESAPRGAGCLLERPAALRGVQPPHQSLLAPRDRAVRQPRRPVKAKAPGQGYRIHQATPPHRHAHCQRRHRPGTGWRRQRASRATGRRPPLDQASAAMAARLMTPSYICSIRSTVADQPKPAACSAAPRAMRAHVLGEVINSCIACA